MSSKMSRRVHYLLLAMLSITCGCSNSDGQQVADPDDAVARGHEAAWMVSHADHNDTIALQRAILDARSIHDEYILTGNDDAASDFELAFIDSLRRADPQLAQEIFDNQ